MKENERITNPYPMTVVIATLGSDILRKTIESINANSIVPTEILICIPTEDSFKVSNLDVHNVVVINTNERGQVVQRACGFMEAKHDLVLQIDDDILLNKNALEELVLALISLGPGNVVAPLYFDVKNGRCLHTYKEGWGGFIKNIYAYLICDAPWGKKRMGALTSLGIAYGVDGNQLTEDVFKTDWLPGGCVLGYRIELIKENYFPLVGKAYSEDVIHSILRNKKGISHYVVRNGCCETDSQPNILDLPTLRDDMEARKYVIRHLSGKKWRLKLWFVFDYFKRLCIHLFVAQK